MNDQQKKLHLLPTLHLILMIGLAVWWGAFFWFHTPSRTIFHLGQSTRRQVHHHQEPLALPWVAAFNDGAVARLALATRAAVADLACGLATLFLVGLGSGVYVRRFDNWLHARASGQAVAFRGQDLTTAALDANAKHQRGVLR